MTPYTSSLRIAVLLGGIWAHLIHVSLVPQHKRHLDLFSRFCWAHYHDSETNRQTTLYSASVASRLHLRSTAIRANAIIIIPQFLGTNHALFEHFAFMPASDGFLLAFNCRTYRHFPTNLETNILKNNLFMILLDI